MKTQFSLDVVRAMMDGFEAETGDPPTEFIMGPELALEFIEARRTPPSARWEWEWFDRVKIVVDHDVPPGIFYCR